MTTNTGLSSTLSRNFLDYISQLVVQIRAVRSPRRRDRLRAASQQIATALTEALLVQHNPQKRFRDVLLRQFAGQVDEALLGKQILLVLLSGWTSRGFQ